jgi:prepilin-type N-terminal cleavage/methylation domain-containing protein
MSVDKNAPPTLLHRSGFSLLEVIVAMGVFAFSAVAVSGLLLYGYRSSVNAVYESTAHAVAQGYVEQIMALDFDRVYAVYEGRNATEPSVLPLKALSPSQTPGASLELDDPLDFSGLPTLKNVVVDLRDDGAGGFREVVMAMRVTLVASDLTQAANPLSALEITLEYEFLAPLSRGAQWSRDRLCFVKSDVPVY